MQLSYWIFFILKFKNIKNANSLRNQDTPAVSLVICLKNEIENLNNNFKSWVGQIDPKDEMILVDDFSSDQTYETADRLLKDFSNGQCLKSSLDRPGKKQALTDGIGAAERDFILLTDADCRPSPMWKETMAQYISPQTDFVLGFAPFHKNAGLLNLFQRFEGVLTALQYFSYAHAGIPYMGVGRNMLFRKAIFDPKIYDDEIASGDDDLLVSALANKENTSLCLDSQSFVYSDAPPTLRKYWHQKLRHISTSPKYKSKIKFLLSLFSGTQILTYILLPIVLMTPYWQVGLFFFVVRLFIIALGLRMTGKMLKEEDLFKMTPLLDLSLTFYYLILAFSYPFKKKTTWN